MMNDNIIYQEQSKCISYSEIVYVALTKYGKIGAIINIGEQKVLIYSQFINKFFDLEYFSPTEAKQIINNMQYKTFLIALHNFCLNDNINNTENLYNNIKNLLKYKIPEKPKNDIRVFRTYCEYI